MFWNNYKLFELSNFVTNHDVLMAEYMFFPMLIE